MLFYGFVGFLAGNGETSNLKISKSCPVGRRCYRKAIHSMETTAIFDNADVTFAGKQHESDQLRMDNGAELFGRNITITATNIPSMESKCAQVKSKPYFEY